MKPECGVDVRSLYVPYYPRLVAALTLVGGNFEDAEDVAQEAFARLVTRWEAVSHYENPEAWVRHVAMSLLSNRRRGHRRRYAALANLRQVDAIDRSAASVEKLDVARALAALPIASRRILVLRHVMGLTVEEIAADLEVPPGTVKSRLARACGSFFSTRG